MNDKPSSASIPTLTNYNFVEWSIQVEGYLKECDCYSFISENEAPPDNPTDLKNFKTKKTRTSGVLQRTMGTSNYSKFKTSTTENDPYQMWKVLKAHYLLSEIANQSKVYNDFLDFTFKGSDISNFLTDLATHINNLRAVGLRIGIPTDFELHENLLCENILRKIPSSLVHTREVLIQNRPLTLSSLQKLLENRSRDDVTTKIKSEESAMKATSSKVMCENGIHNPNSNHTRDQCFELHPEEKVKFEKRREKRRAKAKKASKRQSSDSSASAWHCLMKAQSEKLPSHTAYLDSGASHHMISD
jgi:hypothetical protein